MSRLRANDFLGNRVHREGHLLLSLLLLAPGPSVGQESQSRIEPRQEQAGGGDEPLEGEVRETIVVTATRSEEPAQEVPAAFSVVDAEAIALSPADDFGDLLRAVPGLQVTEINNRDLNVSSRQATSSQSSDLLVLHDGRSLYLDYIGFVMWDLVPIEEEEIERIEVVRGPGSAVWGANALTGVVNLITKEPAALAGTGVGLGMGERDTIWSSVLHAEAGPRRAWKISAGYSEQDAYERPTGLIPGTSTPYPEYPNGPASNPRLDLRLDWGDETTTGWSLSSGWAGSDGIAMTAIGPFEIDPDTWSGYVRLDAARGAWSATLHGTFLDGRAPALLSVGPGGDPVDLTFDSAAYTLEASHHVALGSRHLLTWGGTARQLAFDLSVAPEAQDRSEVGLFVQDEITLGPRLRWFVGMRWDDVDPIGSRLSPRTSLLWSPAPRHTLRLGYHQAFRNPSAINTSADTGILNRVLIPIPGSDPALVVFPTTTFGDPDLSEEELTSWEAGYIANFGRTQLSVAIYRSELDNLIKLVPTSFYGPRNPLPGWPFPPETIPPATFPETLVFANVGEVVNRGLEVALEGRPHPAWRWQLSYTWQDDPEVAGFPASAVNQPPTHRATAGLSYDRDDWFASALVHHQDDAFWTDVLDSRFWGPTEAFTQIDLATGTWLRDGKLRLSLRANNLFDERVQQHVFGDIIGRTVVAEARLRLER